MVSLPYGFTLFSNIALLAWKKAEFHYLMDLHYSQTILGDKSDRPTFHYLMDLHYSQTSGCRHHTISAFHYLMDLHYSQTKYFFTLISSLVSLPYGFTLFSNVRPLPQQALIVSLPYGFTLFSNGKLTCNKASESFTTLWIYTILKRIG